jgi:glycerol-3-phosphate O-acyltransferase
MKIGPECVARLRCVQVQVCLVLESQIRDSVEEHQWALWMADELQHGAHHHEHRLGVDLVQASILVGRQPGKHRLDRKRPMVVEA